MEFCKDAATPATRRRMYGQETTTCFIVVMGLYYRDQLHRPSTREAKSVRRNRRYYGASAWIPRQTRSRRVVLGCDFGGIEHEW